MSGSVSELADGEGPLMEPRSACAPGVNKLKCCPATTCGGERRAHPLLREEQAGRSSASSSTGPYVDLNMGGWMTGGWHRTDASRKWRPSPAGVTRAGDGWSAPRGGSPWMPNDRHAGRAVGGGERGAGGGARGDAGHAREHPQPVGPRERRVNACCWSTCGGSSTGATSPRVATSGSHTQRLSLTVQLDRALPPHGGGPPAATFSGLLQVVEPPLFFTVAGGLDIVKMRYQKALDVDALLKSMQKRSPAAVSAASSVSNEQQALGHLGCERPLRGRAREQ